MLARYCPNCGTEVDENAVFCPTCGQPVDEAAETQIPPAPAWPEPPRDEPPRDVPPRDVPPEPVARSLAEQAPVAGEPELPEPTERTTTPIAAAGDESTDPRWAAPPPPEQPAPEPRRAERPAQAPPPSPPGPAKSGQGEPASPNLRVTAPVTLSGWLIGGGAAIAAVGALIGLFRGVVSPVEFLMLLALVGVAVSVFAASSLPAFAHLRLVVMAVAFIGFGMALDRIGFGRANAGDLLFFLGTAAAAIGTILVDVGQDQPLGGPRT